jgi:hypothetical protein
MRVFFQKKQAILNLQKLILEHGNLEKIRASYRHQICD